MQNKNLHMIAFVLMAIGGINWGLIGLGTLMSADWNLVNMILGSWPIVESIVYVLVGASTVFVAVGHKKDCRVCG